MYNKEALRKLLEDCWDAGYAHGMVLGGKARKQAKNTYITSKLSEMSVGEDELKKQNAEWREECERLAGLVEFWQDKYYELNPPWQPKKLDNL